ncbi:LrgB family protein [Neobacillus sp. D3-1R]|uniref:LrgB family protein n=1 Tax=Neobacillus sp. D3-1R TaxID=3445778 RepID=UPI003F9F381B
MKLIFITVLNILITIGAFTLSRFANKKYPSPFTTPVFFSTLLIIIVFLTIGIDYEEYGPAKKILSFMLGPATVALAVPLYKNRKIIFKYIFPASTGLILGSLSTIYSAVLISKMLHLPNAIITSISIKSVTVPVAVEVAKIIGADPSLTAVFVIVTGIIGSMIGPWIMNLFRISNPLSRGLALGTISHGIGTAEAVTEGELQGAISGAAMALSAIFTSLIAPFIHYLY